MAEQRTLSVGATGSSRGRVTSSSLHKTNQLSNDLGRTFHPGESGFTSNLRPVIGYRPTLDLVDNPQFGLLLSDNFITQTKCHYRPYVYCDGPGPLPNLFNKFRESGFFQLNTSPKPLSRDEKTEYQSLYVPHPLLLTVSPEKVVTVGQKQHTGFTEGVDLQINTFIDKTSAPIEPRFTHDSVMKTDFLAHSHLQRTKVIPSLRSHSCRETGYTRGTTAPLADPCSLLPSPCKITHPSLLKTIGKKEPSGFLHNAPNHRMYPLTPQQSSHFVTHYQNMFCANASLRNRWSHSGPGIIHNKMDNGYTRREMDRFIIRDPAFRAV